MLRSRQQNFWRMFNCALLCLASSALTSPSIAAETPPKASILFTPHRLVAQFIGLVKPLNHQTPSLAADPESHTNLHSAPEIRKLLATLRQQKPIKTAKTETRTRTVLKTVWECQCICVNGRWRWCPVAVTKTVEEPYTVETVVHSSPIIGETWNLSDPDIGSDSDKIPLPSLKKTAGGRATLMSRVTMQYFPQTIRSFLIDSIGELDTTLVLGSTDFAFATPQSKVKEAIIVYARINGANYDSIDIQLLVKQRSPTDVPNQDAQALNQRAHEILTQIIANIQ